ncbi:helix-turn-helix transcriptional regulator [Roseibium sp.]|uniref:helix-turn-helix transcriptional regulator n=1 Tax=Roseibium sp. TaxID=1936156 RepID=UPI003D09DABC
MGVYVAVQAIEAIREANTVEELKAALPSSLEQLGFDNFGISCNKKEADELVLDPTLTTLSDAFRQDYERLGWVRNNPLLDEFGNIPVYRTWSVDADRPDRQFQEYAEFLTDIGMGSGIVVPLAKCPLMSVFCVEAPTPGAFPLDLVQQVAILGNATAIKVEMLGLGASDVADESAALRALSSQQVEILKWAAEGKSNTDIATILNLSKRGVAYHMSEILRKLGVASRAQAVSACFGGR